ncbi:TetR-like C-terminal domain-containing protein [Rhizomonospora bruguierae]|uniref:TetR-like C-terminal domain-containing protein n=1 Tax=Rhizomonospora bruguierae TaxID=1581705 RepID=UPI0020C0E354|nr:TetR-like C-terminal domain-containing protein [Micromonospora sp. NBRC 107566]
MPRTGLDPAAVVAAAAGLADEVGLANVTMGLLAKRLGVRAPSLYKHVDGQADLNRRIAVLALTELDDALRAALQGRSGREALAAAARTIPTYVVEHPGRYAATIRIDADGPGGPIVAAGARVLDSLSAVLAGYRLDPADTVHALRLLRSLFHGFAVLEAAGGFELDTDVGESFEWLIGFVDRGLTVTAATPHRREHHAGHEEGQR